MSDLLQLRNKACTEIESASYALHWSRLRNSNVRQMESAFPSKAEVEYREFD